MQRDISPILGWNDWIIVMPEGIYQSNVSSTDYLDAYDSAINHVDGNTFKPFKA